ncbi:YlqD family protein [Anaeromusa sp.]|jgi:DNA polymerase III gamma/tau subunit|uniref:YlqD family protein n=1 Tax=Anaeromusa sp. TaxID=1872520 RepID=UPI00260D7156|nr:YlqD family protein [Anaeromusa sp.]MDD3158866.1 YlqD family protein [Anaeromusa sp.]MEA4833657.1 YlqD family protein [Anaeromusa sp.]NCB75561.1 16S rRNA processing protein RimM [Negativicutes bacterium]
MDSMTLKCPVTIKAKVTEELKQRLIAETEEALQGVELELQQIEFHAKRLLAEQAKQDAQGLVALRQQIEAEKQKRLEFKNEMLAKLKATQELELGSEIVRGQLERVVDVKVGDDLNKIMGSEILLEDGKVLAFRS